MADRSIAVVGSGMVGAALALGIARKDLADQLIWIGGQVQPALDTPGRDARVIACSAASQKLLDELGVWSRLPGDRLCAYQRMHIWEHLGTAELDFETPGDAQCLGWIVENALLNQHIEAAVRESDTLQAGQLEIRLGTRVDALHQVSGSEQQQISLENGEQFDVDLVLAVDGAFSTLRQLSGLPANERDTGQRSLVAVLDHSQPHLDCAWQNFLPSGPLAFLPLAVESGRHASAIVWSLDKDQVDSIESLDDQQFLRRLTRYAPAELGQLLAVDARAGFDICQHRMPDYGRPGLIFAGDAAHRVHPLAGQGANLGFADVACLLQELQRNLQRGESLASSALLRRYQRQRRWQNDLAVDLMSGFQLAYGTNEPHWRVARNTAIRVLNQSGWMKNKLARAAMGDIPS